MKKTLIGLTALLVLTGAACGGDNGDGSSQSPATGGADAGCTADNAVDLTGDDPFSLTIKDFAYDPSCFAAKSAASITITNEDSVTHTFTIDGTPVDVSIPAGETFDGGSAGLAPGTYPFRCTIHPKITGTVIVT